MRQVRTFFHVLGAISLISLIPLAQKYGLLALTASSLIALFSFITAGIIGMKDATTNNKEDIKLVIPFLLILTTTLIFPKNIDFILFIFIALIIGLSIFSVFREYKSLESISKTNAGLIYIDHSGRSFPINFDELLSVELVKSMDPWPDPMFGNVSQTEWLFCLQNNKRIYIPYTYYNLVLFKSYLSKKLENFSTKGIYSLTTKKIKDDESITIMCWQRNA